MAEDAVDAGPRTLRERLRRKRARREDLPLTVEASADFDAADVAAADLDEGGAGETYAVDYGNWSIAPDGASVPDIDGHAAVAHDPSPEPAQPSPAQEHGESLFGEEGRLAELATPAPTATHENVPPSVNAPEAADVPLTPAVPQVNYVPLPSDGAQVDDVPTAADVPLAADTPGPGDAPQAADQPSAADAAPVFDEPLVAEEPATAPTAQIAAFPSDPAPQPAVRALRPVELDPQPRRKRGERADRVARSRRRAGAGLPEPEVSRASVDRSLIAPLERPAPRPERAAPSPNTARGRRKAGRRERAPNETDPPADPKADAAGARKRRHNRMSGGGTVMIGDALYPLIDWSVGGIAVASDQQRLRVGERKMLELEIDLLDYAVNLDLEAEVVNRNAEKTGFQFVYPSETQRELLRVLAQVAQKNQPFAAPGTRRSRAIRDDRPAPSESRLWREFRPMAALISLPLNAAIIALIVSLVIFSHNPDAGDPGPSLAVEDASPPVRADHAAVAVERLALQSDVSGVILEWGVQTGEAVNEGDALVSVGLLDADEGRVVLTSPCDCFLARILAVPGQGITAGTTVALLYDRGVEGHVQALFPSGRGPNLGDAVTVALPYSGDRYQGVVESVGRLDDPAAYIGLPSSLVQSGDNAVFARIRTTPAVPPALAGDPAIVTLRPEA